jgi:hypothetical protein
VTATTDWPAVITGIVGVAGITATYFQNRAARKAASADLTKSLNATAGNLSTRINAENLRALQMEKQRVYSEFQGSMDDVFVVALRLHGRDTGEADLSAALNVMYRATAAVKLIAPEPLGNLANETAQAMANETGTTRVGTDIFDRDNKIFNNRQELYRLMRIDVGVDLQAHGESPLLAQQQASSLPQARDGATATPPPGPPGIDSAPG